MKTRGLGATLDATWGTSLCFSANFRERWGLVSSARQVIAELCDVYLTPNDRSAALVMAAQELLENLAKYSLDGSACFEFELRLREGVPEACISTRNLAPVEHLLHAEELLERIVSSTAPVALYDAWLATSGEREGSRLGLIRLRAEAGFTLSYALDDSRGLEVVVTGQVDPRRAS